jgi:DNA repair protein RadC
MRSNLGQVYPSFLFHSCSDPLFARHIPPFPAVSQAAAPTTSLPYTIPVYRVELVRERSIAYHQPQFRSSADVARLLQTVLASVDREHCMVILLDRKHRLIGLNTVAIGSLTAAVVHPREVFKPAILANAAAIIVAHNHPSGDLEPSQEDKVLTRKLVLAGEALSIQVLDHLVLGHQRYYSFKDEGAL